MQLTPDKAAGRSLGWVDCLSSLRGTRGTGFDDGTSLPRKSQTYHRTSVEKDLRRAIDYDLEQERAHTYKDKKPDEMISHLTRFVSGLWQIHAFAEGNTRITAVFTIQYLRSLGFEVDNDLFAKHSWYFRNALVRANYRNVAKGIEYTPVYLERIFRNLLLGLEVFRPDDAYVGQGRLSFP